MVIDAALEEEEERRDDTWEHGAEVFPCFKSLCKGIFSREGNIMSNHKIKDA